MQEKIYYETPPMTIEKHEWKIMVTDHFLGGRCTKYIFRGLSNSICLSWLSQYQWKSYDPDDSYLGLPRKLSELFEAYEADIKENLDGSYQRKQLDMFTT